MHLEGLDQDACTRQASLNLTSRDASPAKCELLQTARRAHCPDLG